MLEIFSEIARNMHEIQEIELLFSVLTYTHGTVPLELAWVLS